MVQTRILVDDTPGGHERGYIHDSATRWYCQPTCKQTDVCSSAVRVISRDESRQTQVRGHAESGGIPLTLHVRRALTSKCVLERRKGFKPVDVLVIETVSTNLKIVRGCLQGTNTPRSRVGKWVGTISSFHHRKKLVNGIRRVPLGES